MFKKLFVDLVQGLHANTRAIQVQTEVLALGNVKLIDIDRSINAGLGDLLKTQLALMSGTERARYDALVQPIDVILPPQEVDNE